MANDITGSFGDLHSLSGSVSSLGGWYKDVIRYSQQSLTSSQKEVARTNIEAYAKPGTGIPVTDMASSVQSTLSNADSAYISVHDYVEETYNMFSARDFFEHASITRGTITIFNDDMLRLTGMNSSSRMDVIYPLGTLREFKNKIVHIGFLAESSEERFTQFHVRYRIDDSGVDSHAIWSNYPFNGYITSTFSFSEEGTYTDDSICSLVFRAVGNSASHYVDIKKLLLTFENTGVYVPHKSFVDGVARAEIEELKARLAQLEGNG